MEKTAKKALFVYGGWEGHHPSASADIVAPLLREHGFEVSTEQSLEAYADVDFLRSHDVIVHNWSMGEILPDELFGLTEAVRAGVGLAGWHGGIADSFRMTSEYMHMVGGQFAAHPHDFVDFDVTITSDHEVVAGIESFSMHSEQYWVLSDGLNKVHATTTIPVREGDPWQEPVTSPVVWTRQWGAGRVFVSTLGHSLADLMVPQAQEILVRGVSWAAQA